MSDLHEYAVFTEEWDQPAGPRAQVAVELIGTRLRYTEVEHTDNEDRATQTLRRLGTCDFDFEVDRAVFGRPEPNQLDALMSAVRDLFEGTSADALHVALHPTHCVGFFTPVPDGLEPEVRFDRLRREAALMADAEPDRPGRVRAVPVRSQRLASGPQTWHHVIHVPEAVHARLKLLAQQLGRTARYELADTTQAAAALVSTLTALGTDPDSFQLGLGVYPAHVEVVVCQAGQWYAGHHAPARTPEDAAYFVFRLLSDLGLATDALTQWWLYGEGTDLRAYDLMATLLKLEPQRLNPLRAFGLPAQSGSPVQMAAYVPCVGAALV
ncbi:MAG: hypothetical protein AAFV01_08135 [Bacteroidota bacterium]